MESKQVKVYEWKTVAVHEQLLHTDELDCQINAMAPVGWEFVKMEQVTFGEGYRAESSFYLFFKRPVVEEEKERKVNLYDRI
jgi:hypothetical protein